MSIYEIHQKATNNKDIDAYAATLHDEYEFISHMDGMTMNREQAMEMFTFLMNSEDFVTHESRCLYENDEVAGVSHGTDSGETYTGKVLCCGRKRDGKFYDWRLARLG